MDIPAIAALRCPLFKGLSVSEAGLLLSNLNYRTRTYSQGSVIVSAGEKCDRLIILMDGDVSAEMIDETGKLVKLEDIKAPSPLAPSFLFGQMDSFPVTVIANVPSAVMVIYKDDLLALFQASRQVLVNYLDQISTRAQFLSRKVQLLCFGSLRKKLAHFILSASASQQGPFKLGKTQQQLAELFGAQRTSVTRSLSELRDSGYISIDNKYITVLDKKALSELV
jgi:CRP/FNR family transcriptional regulator, dissimilatory nitrate respiration regulator